MHNICYWDYEENVSRDGVIDDICDYAMREGDGYCGPLKWHDGVTPLKNREEAENFIKGKDNGWYDDHAVRYYDYSKAKETKKMIELQGRVDAANKRLADFQNEHSILKRKAGFVGCPACGSKLSRKYLSGEKCPICGQDLRSEAVLKRLKAIEKTRESLIGQLKDEREKQERIRQVKWLVKFEFHS